MKLPTSVILLAFVFSLSLAQPTPRQEAADKTQQEKQEVHPEATEQPGAPLGADGRVVDTEEVSLAKVQHTAAHRNHQADLEKELERSSSAPSTLLLAVAPPVLNYDAYFY